MFSPVVYIHADPLEHRWYQYRRGYYGLCTWYPVKGNVLGPLSVSGVYQADLQLFHQHMLGLTLSPAQVYDNYCKDLQIRQYFHCSYEQYMNHIINMLSDCPEIDLNSDSSESHKTISDHMQASIPAALLDMRGEMVSSGAVSNTQEIPLLGGFLSGSPKKGINKINLVNKYFPDKRTGFISMHQDTSSFIGPD